MRSLQMLVVGAVLAALGGAEAADLNPLPTATAPSATPVASPSPVAPLPSATSTRTAPSATPTSALPHATPAGGTEGEPEGVAPENEGRELPAATAALVRPRTYRTPERAAPPAFVAPEADGGEPDAGAAPMERAPMVGGRPATRSSSGLVVFRFSARTGLEGFDIRVAYPTAVGSFGNASRPADCSAGSGMIVTANDRGNGELRLLVASAQALPFPLDVFCHFAVEPGGSIDAGAFGVRVAEVASNGKKADPGLLLVDIVVR